jgi:hypothetical protein
MPPVEPRIAGGKVVVLDSQLPRVRLDRGVANVFENSEKLSAQGYKHFDWVGVFGLFDPSSHATKLVSWFVS